MMYFSNAYLEPFGDPILVRGRVDPNRLNALQEP